MSQSTSGDGFVVVDARQKKLDVVVGSNEGIFERPCIRLRVNTRGSFCPKTIVSDTIRKLSVSFSHRLRVNGA